MRLAVAAPVALSALALGACGESNDIDASKTEREIAKGVEKQTATEDVKIDCPDGVEKKKSGVFECDLSAKGGVKAVVKVTQIDDQGNVEWQVNPLAE